MNTKTNQRNLGKKLTKVHLPGRNQTPTSKSDLIRRLSKRKLSTGEIKKKVEEAGMSVHYSEIYGAIQRTQPVAAQ